jgi:hypothetical protein
MTLMRAVAAMRFAAAVPGVTSDQVLASPFVLLASDAAAAAAELRRRREEFRGDTSQAHELISDPIKWIMKPRA